MAEAQSTGEGMYLALISVHGLIRGQELELGRDADTGGQTLYVVELARALARQPKVARIDLLTRLVDDPEVSAEYAQPTEQIADNCWIRRVAAGPNGYIAKEQLWDYIDMFADNALNLLRAGERLPDLIHSHYADAGYVGARLSNLLGIPLVHTGHSLGRVKRRRLLAAGLSPADIEQRYHMSRRVEAEELTLATAKRVITSTHQEIEQQYGLYDHYQPELMRVIPPGTDVERFQPPRGNEWDGRVGAEVRRFLRQPDKPIVLALSRPDTRKNIGSLVKAFGESQALRAKANLVIVAGNREDIGDLDEGAREVWTSLLMLIDRYDLYGQVAVPKHHKSDDVPEYYRLTALSKGVFVNPALTEPFGLTLIEAAASGLPIVATEDGGPRDIVGNCNNGLLVDPLDTAAIAEALLTSLADEVDWLARAAAGLRGVQEYYSWPGHASRYVDLIKPIADRTEVLVRRPRNRRPMLYHDRAIFTDLDQNLLGDPQSLRDFIQIMQENRKCASFGIATGRRLDSALKVMKRYGIPEPDVLITAGGTELHYAPKLTMDQPWSKHIDHHWQRERVREVLADLPGLKLQERSEQSRYKISYFIDPAKAPCVDEIGSLLHQQDQSVNVVLSFGQFLDILPIRASKGLALRYFAARWEIALERILVAGGSGADEDMMRGNTLAVVVSNRHNEELSRLVDVDRIYFAERSHARGILEAIDHYEFFRSCTVPEEEHVA